MKFIFRKAKYIRKETKGGKVRYIYKEPSYKTYDFRFYLDLPKISINNRKIRNIMNRFKVKVDYRLLDSKKLKSRHVTGTNIIAINREDLNNNNVLLHELGHHIYDQKIDKIRARHLFDYYRKNMPKLHKQRDWILIDNNPVFIGRGRDAIKEMYADLFKYYINNKLKGINKKVMGILLGEVNEA